MIVVQKHDWRGKPSLRRITLTAGPIRMDSPLVSGWERDVEVKSSERQA
jgi:hypothetical protein